ncbi:MAG: 2-succinyl-5-enolpyruvyl-6-hydroxy-3-cyclohexene-1-carboxylic-acid synthase [Thermoanaerobaculia bacterium]|nr:2-succinyl-5-enolpyruvyl-6-hydroxy-3-cyclohexene-1-carboxylic-acid synthase [Thermoanaerobaculia bacterium]
MGGEEQISRRPSAADADALVQTRWARVLVTSLADAGIRDVFVSPGSRSTPLLLAVLRLAGEGRLRCHDVVDERSAGFLALGRVRTTGRPVVLLCTSGSAPTHYYPAVVEADADRLPLLILSADRPVELQHCGANQTLDQLHLFGRNVRRFVDLGLADASPDALRSLRRQAAQCVFDAMWPVAGAVHLNARARKPLEPPSVEDTSPEVEALLARPIVLPVAPRHMPPRREIDLLLDNARRARGGLIVAGPAHLDRGTVRDRLRLVAARLRWPVIADSTSQLRDGETVQAAPALLDTSFARKHAPDVVLQVGRPPAASSWGRCLRDWTLKGNTRLWVLGADAWSDPESVASHLVFGDVDACLDQLLDRLELATELPREEARDYQTVWRRASDLARHASHKICHAEPGRDSQDLIPESVAIHRVVSALPPRAQLILGNSLPVREVDLWLEGEQFDRREVLHQRGLSGIDGNVAGAVGAALGGTPTLLLIGDVSLRHDLGSLELTRRVPGLVIVVLDNHGGRIFEHLPLAGHPTTTPDVFEHWLQGAELDLESVAASQGLRYLRPSSGSEITSAVRGAFETEGRSATWLLHLVVEPSSAVEAARMLGRRLQALLDHEGLS